MSTALTREMTVYELEIVATEIAFEVRVNDQPALRMPVSSVRTTFDINPYVESGQNTLSLTVRPRTRGRDFSEHAACKVALRTRPHPESSEMESIGTLVFSGYGTHAVTGFGQSVPAPGGGPVEVERFGAKGTLGFILDTTFPPWGWTTAEKLVRTEALRAEVLAQYRHIHDLLSRRDAAALEALCALQAEDFRHAYYLGSIADARQLLGITALLSDSAIGVEPFPESILNVEVLGGGRLVELVDDDGKSPLRLSSSDAPEMVGRFNIVLCKMGGSYQIAR